jgi:hypothetical protein
MGNSSSQEQHIDYGNTTPFGILYKEEDYDKDVVKRSIMERRLSPFYKGQETVEAFYEKLAETDQKLDTKKSSSKVSIHSFKSSSQSLRKESSRTSVQDLMHEPIECPICFLVL